MQSGNALNKSRLKDAVVGTFNNKNVRLLSPSNAASTGGSSKAKARDGSLSYNLQVSSIFDENFTKFVKSKSQANKSKK